MSRLRLILLGVFLAAAVVTAAFFVAGEANNQVVSGDPQDPAGVEDPEPQDPPPQPDPPEPFNCTVGLYTGKGSWPEGVEAFKNFLDDYNLDYRELDQEMVGNADLNELCNILLIGGGFSEEYRYYIKSHANIRSFVENGGIYVGICAGAYYAASTMRWKGKPLDYPLRLFSGEAVGPLSRDLAWGEKTAFDLNSEIEFLREYPETLEMWYFDGPYFTAAPGSGVDILARYRVNGEAAIVSFGCGKGRVLLLGPHPELGCSDAGVKTDGSSGAQWPWLYDALQWLVEQSN